MTEENNNYMNDSKDGASTNRIEINPMSETKVRGGLSKELPSIDKTEADSVYYTKNIAGDIDVDNSLNEVDSTLERMKPKRNPVCKTRNRTTKNIIVESESSIIEIKPRRRGRRPKKQQTKSEESFMNGNPVIETYKDISLERLLQSISMTDIDQKTENYLECKPEEAVMEEELMNPEPVEMNNNPEVGTELDEPPETTTVQIDSISTTSKPRRPAYPSKRNKRQLFAPRRVKKSKDDETVETTSTDSLLGMETDSKKVETIKKTRGRKPRSIQPKKLIKSTAPMEIIINSTETVETTSTDSLLEIETDSKKVGTMKKPRGRKPKSIQPKKLIKSTEPIEIIINSTETVETTSTDSFLGMETDSKKVETIKKTRGRKPRSIQPKKLIKSTEPIEIIINSTETVETTSTDSFLGMETDSKKVETIKKTRGRKPRSIQPKELIKSTEPMEIIINNTDNTKCDAGSSTSREEIVTISDITKPKIKRKRKARAETLKPLPKSVPMNESEMNPELKINDILLLTEEKISSEVPKPKPKRGRKARVTAPKELMGLQSLEITSESSEIKDTPLAAEVQTALITEAAKPKPKRIRIPRAKTPRLEIRPELQNQEAGCETKDAILPTQVHSDVITEKAKPKAKRMRKSRAQAPKEIIKIQSMDEEQTVSAETNKDTLLRIQVRTEVITDEVTKPKAKRIRKSRANAPKLLIKSETIDEERRAESSAEMDDLFSLSETLKIFDDLHSNSSEDPIGLENTKIINNDDKLSSDNDDNLSNSISKTKENKYLLHLDKMYQPKVVLFDIAYSDKISPERREELLLKKINSPDSLINESIMERSSTSNDIINQESENTNEESFETVSRFRPDEYYDHPIPIRERRSRRKRKLTTQQSKVKELKSYYRSKLSVRDPETSTSSASQTDDLSSIGNKLLSIGTKRCSPESTELSNEGNNFGKKLTQESKEEMLSLPLSDVPLDLSIRESEKSLSNESAAITKPSGSLIAGFYSSGSKNHQSGDRNVQDIGFGSSTFNVVNLSTSFVEIDNAIDPRALENVNNLNEEKNDICGNNATMMKEYNKEENLKTNNESSEVEKQKLQIEVESDIESEESLGRRLRCKRKIRAKTRKQIIKSKPINKVKTKATRKTINDEKPLVREILQTIPTTSKIERASSKLKKSPVITDRHSLKVSLPAEHYFSKQSTSRDDSDDQITGKKKPKSRKVGRKSHPKADGSGDRRTRTMSSQNTTCDETSPKRNLRIAEIRKTVTGNCDQRIEVSVPLPDVIASDDPQKKSDKCETGIIETVREPMVVPPEELKPVVITDVRSLPRIITDEIFPKGTIDLSSINNAQQQIITNMENGNELLYSKNVNADHPIDENDLLAYSSDNIDNMNITAAINNTFGNLEESINTDGDLNRNEQFPEYMETDETDNNPVFDDHQDFDPTHLWKICPEAAEYFSHDDVVNNNNSNEDRSSNFANLRLNNKNENKLGHDESEDGSSVPVLNIINCDKTDNVESQSSKSVSTQEQNESESIKRSVIVNLTKANLRNFNNISNQNTKSELWGDYLLHGENIKKHCGNIKSTQDTIIETSCEGTEFTLESQKANSSHQTDCKKRKRKWMQGDEGNRISKPSVIEKKRKLNRNRCRNEGQDLDEDTNNLNSQKLGSIHSDNSINLMNVIRETIQSPEKTCSQINSVDINVNVVKETIAQDQPQLDEDEEMKEEIQTKDDEKECESDKLGERMISFIEMEDKEEITVNNVPVNTITDTQTMECDIEKDCSGLEEERINVTSQETNDSKKDNIDKSNRKSTSTSSSSSSSSSASGSPENRKSIDTNNLEGPINNLDDNDSGKDLPPENENSKNEKRIKIIENAPADTEEDDADCISLYAESLFTNDHAMTHATECISLSPLFDNCEKEFEKGEEEVEETYQEITNVGEYFDKNVQEFDEAYDFCDNDDSNILAMNNSNFQMDNHHRNPIVPQLSAAINLNQLNRMNESERNVLLSSASTSLYPAAASTSFEMCKTNTNNNNNINKNLKDRLGEKKFYTTENNIFQTISPESYFHRHCFSKLMRGACNRKGNCHHFHHLSPSLANIQEEDASVVRQVIDYAIYKGYNYFVDHKYPDIIERMDYVDLLGLFLKLSSNGLMTTKLIEYTISSVLKLDLSVKDFVRDIAGSLNQNNDILGERILEVIANEIKPGSYWATCRDLLVRMKPFNSSITRVIHESITYNKNKSEIEDVYINYVKRFTVEQVSNININLRGQFDLLLLENNLIHENIDIASIDQPAAAAALFVDVNSAENDNDIQDRAIDIPTILSPDNSGVHCSYDNSLRVDSPANRQDDEKFSSQESSGMKTLTKNQGADDITWNNRNLVLNGSRISSAAQFDSLGKEHSLDPSNIRTSESGADANSSDNSSSYKLYPIDDLQPPQSAFRDRHWKFNLAMNNLKEALKHNEYTFALKILDNYSIMDKTLFTTSCYKMLRENVMASAHHVKNIIKLSVWIGVNNKSLNETLFKLGMFTMIELCDTNSWVLAHSLFKSLKNSGILSSNVENIPTAFYLISAEIYLANRRPLKAFDILKQNNLLCKSQSKSMNNVINNERDHEPVRIMIIHLLLDILSQEHPDRAFYIFNNLVKEQPHIYHPVDLTAYIDKLVTGILNGNFNDLVIDVAKLIIDNNFCLKNSVFRLLVRNIFQTDLTLCRKFYRYGIMLGVYPIVKLDLPLRLLIKTNWTKEEMYLVVIEFLEKLSMDIGPAVDRIGPNHFAIHLVFELEPFREQRAPENNRGMILSNKDELKLSKELMKTVLREQFNPPLKTILAEKDRFVKFQSRSVVNYLKSIIGRQ